MAERFEMSAQFFLEEGDKEMAHTFMSGAHTIRRLLKTLGRLNHRVHYGYDFRVDPDAMTLEAQEVLLGSGQDVNGSLEKEIDALIDERDRAEKAADTMASIILDENIDWSDHEGKWKEAIHELILKADRLK